MKEPFKRGDLMVCCFRRGHEGNPIGIAPDGRIAILDRAHHDAVQEGAPYVCSVKAAGKGPDGPRSYVVRLERPLSEGDYDRLEHADFQRHRLRLALAIPTWFASLRSRTLDADIEEHALGDPARPTSLLVRLRRGGVMAELEATPDEAVRRGLRFNAFVPDKHGEAPVPARLRHPAPPAPGWRPRGVDEVGYLCRTTSELAVAVPAAIASLGEAAFQDMAVHRATAVLALRAYDPVPLDSPQAVALELALTAAVRLACLTHPDARARSSLALAEKRLLAKRIQGVAGAAVAGLLRRLGLEARHEGNFVSCPLRAYLDATPARRDGEWSLANLQIEKGRVLLTFSQARAIVCDRAHDALHDERVFVPDDVATFLAPLKERVGQVLGELDADHAQATRRPCAFDAYPPCVTQAIHRAQSQELGEAEAWNAFAFLARIGVPAPAAASTLYGLRRADPDRYVTPHSTGKTSATWLRPPPCNVNRLLGICCWDCGVQSPLEHHAKEATK